MVPMIKTDRTLMFQCFIRKIYFTTSKSAQDANKNRVKKKKESMIFTVLTKIVK